MNGKGMSVSDFLENDNITDPRHIIEGKVMLDLLNKDGLIIGYRYIPHADLHVGNRF